MRRLGPLLALCTLWSCSLLVQFDPESQPCDSTGACLSGYTCVNNLCKAIDGGVLGDAGAGGGTGGGSGDAGCTVTRENCANGLDDDCDGQKDCADSDCAAQPCDDGNGCTTGETCSAMSRTCAGGTPRTCTTPGPCERDAGTCELDAGRCVYPAAVDGTSCGSTVSARCCTGSCINTTVGVGNCGGCGLACSTGQLCQSINQSLCGTEPIDTSARCTCGPGAACPKGQACTAGSCVPALATQCAPGEMVVTSSGTCQAYCRY